MCAAEFLQLLQQLLALRYRPRLIYPGIADYSFGVDHVDRALVHTALLVENAVGLADRTVRPEIREQRKGNASQLFRPALEAGNGIGADLKDLAVQLLEFFVVRTEPIDLVRSSTSERKRHECDHRRSAPVAGKRNLLIGVVRGERKIRCCYAFFDFHSNSPCIIKFLFWIEIR